MADFLFNIAKGREATYAALGAAADALIVVPIEATGVVTDAVMKDYDNLSLLLAGTSNEQTTLTRKTLTAVTVTVDDTNDKVTIDAADIVYTAATGTATAKLILCYDADTAAGTDADIVPIVGWDFVATPSGGDITAAINAAGIADLT